MKRSGILTGIATLIVSFLLVGSPPAAADALDSLERCIGAAEKVADYTAVIHQRQRINDVIRPEEVILYKFKRPNWVFIEWIGDVNNVMEVVYREGHDDNKLKVRLGGMLEGIVLRLNPGGSRSLEYTRHPIGESSLIHLLNTLEKSIRYSKAHPADELTVVDGGTMTVFGKELTRIVVTTPYRPGGPYYAPRSVFGIDETTNLPRYYASYGEAGELWEEYRFRELRVNVGLSDSDFEVKRTEHEFGT